MFYCFTLFFGGGGKASVNTRNKSTLTRIFSVLHVLQAQPFKEHHLVCPLQEESDTGGGVQSAVTRSWPAKLCLSADKVIFFSNS